MIDLDEARRILRAHVRPGPAISIPLNEALHRTLAAPVRADLDDPPFDRAMMDGYAVRAADVAAPPVKLRIAGRISAGEVCQTGLSAGEALWINTGAPVPEGADAVVPVEYTGPADSRDAVVIKKSVASGEFLAARASHWRAGEVILERGALLTPLRLSLAGMAGTHRITVYRQPRVAVLVTGDELVEIDRKPRAAQIRNSNQYLLEALTATAHAAPVVLGIAPDDLSTLRRRIEGGLSCDVVCLTGGVSRGTRDFVPEVLESCGAACHIRELAINPGRRMVFATMRDGTLAFGLPGGPRAVLVLFELLVRPALAALEGRPEAEPTLVRATLQGSVAPTDHHRSYRLARAWVDEDGGWRAEPLSWRRSEDSPRPPAANALLMRPPRADPVTTGDAVSVILLECG